MTELFISYAQNFEDVLLWRALKSISNGFFVDVGAAWPKDHSVTAAFYNSGWTGINIEPNPTLYNELVKHRKRDINLNVIVGELAEKDKQFFIIPDTGLSTTVKEIAASHSGIGFESQAISIEQRTLADIFDEYCQGKEMHFLKVDAEGAEESVIKGNDWRRYRPWICVIESTLPLTNEDAYSGWEKILIDNDYDHVYSDGLNRFYVRSESKSLAQFFQYPPNFFDGYESYEVVKLRERIRFLEGELRRLGGPARSRNRSRWSLAWMRVRSLWRK